VAVTEITALTSADLPDFSQTEDSLAALEHLQAHPEIILQKVKR